MNAEFPEFEAACKHNRDAERLEFFGTIIDDYLQGKFKEMHWKLSL